MSTSTACPECGLRFADGQRQFSTFGRPVVTIEQHLGYHAEMQAKEARAERARRTQNAFPLVEGHQLTEALCDGRCSQAEVQSAIRLPVVAVSSTTNHRPEESAVLLDEFPLPAPSKIASHLRVYGSEGTKYLETASVPKLPSVRRTKRSRAAMRDREGDKRHSQGKVR